MDLELLYVHGFGSGAGGTKLGLLKNYCEAHRFARVHCLPLDYEATPPDEVVERLRETLNALSAREGSIRIGIIGSSLGGFYALQLHAMTGFPTVLLNPSLSPAATMQARGLPKAYVEGYQRLQDVIAGKEFPEVRCMVCEDDEVLDHSKIERFGFDLIKLPHGGHRMSPFADVMPDILDRFR
jgi:predicted esterase YcpF (UPF0227 family)